MIAAKAIRSIVATATVLGACAAVAIGIQTASSTSDTTGCGYGYGYGSCTPCPTPTPTATATATASPTGSASPTGILPTGILPTGILPTGILPTLAEAPRATTTSSACPSASATPTASHSPTTAPTTAATTTAPGFKPVHITRNGHLRRGKQVVFDITNIKPGALDQIKQYKPVKNTSGKGYHYVLVHTYKIKAFSGGNIHYGVVLNFVGQGKSVVTVVNQRGQTKAFTLLYLVHPATTTPTRRLANSG